MTAPSESVERHRAPRVAYLVNVYPKVSHSFIRREILALERRGVQVHRFAVRGWDEAVVDPQDKRERESTRYLLRDGAKALLGPTFRTLRRNPGRFFETLALAVRMGRRADRPLVYHLVYFAQACRLLGWLQAAGATHLHAHFGSNPAEVAMLVRSLGGPPYSFTVHGPEEFDKPHALKLSDKVQRAAFVVAISSFGRSQLYRWTEHAQWSKVKVVHCGIEASFHSGVQADPPAAPRVVCIGRLCEQKGQLLLVQAVGKVVREGCAIELVLAGDGEMRAAIEALIAALGLREHVRITGWISSQQVREEIVAARAVALPSFAEGLPVVLMEAMALRRPVITTYVAGIPELVRDQENGWLVPAGDVDALAAVLRRCLLASPEELESLGAAAQVRALERHDIDIEAGKLAALFDSAGSAAPRVHGSERRSEPWPS